MRYPAAVRLGDRLIDGAIETNRSPLIRRRRKGTDMHLLEYAVTVVVLPQIRAPSPR
jgi:hypothetical protein